MKASGGGGRDGAKHEVATAAFEKMSKRQQLALLAAAGLKAGPNVSLAYAIDKFRRDKIREVFLYLVFLLLFTVSALVQRDVTDAHYYTQTVKDAILNENFPGVTWYKTFQDVSIDSDFWDYITTVIPKYLYTEEWYNGEKFTDAELNYVLHMNRLVQAPRLRQLRVKQTDCPVPARLSKVISVCYPQFSNSLQNKSEIPGWPPGERLAYQTDQQLQTGSYHQGLLPYGGGGFALDIPLYYNKTQALEFFNYLKQQRWTDLHTRAVFFDFVLYNPVNGMYLSVRLLFEFLPYGQVRPSSQLRAIRMGLSSLNDYAALMLDALVYLMVIFYMVMDTRKLFAMGRGYWTQFWHWFNWANYTVFIITLVFKLQFLIPSLNYVSGQGDLDIQRATMDFESLGWSYYQIVNWQAFNNVFVWFKAFSFLKFINADVANLAYTVTHAAKDCGLFLLIFAMVIFAYAQAFHISFGTDIGEYKTLLDSIFGLFKTLLGDFDFEAIKSVNAILGPLLFITFEVVCYFVFLNMFLAILNKTYADVIDKGVDDPMAVEFRSTVGRYVQQLVRLLMFWKSKDELARFRQEEAAHEEEEQALQQLGLEEKKNTLDREALDMMLHTIQELSATVRGLNDKIDAISKVQALTGATHKMQMLGTSPVAGGTSPLLAGALSPPRPLPPGLSPSHGEGSPPTVTFAAAAPDPSESAQTAGSLSPSNGTGRSTDTPGPRQGSPSNLNAPRAGSGSPMGKGGTGKKVTLAPAPIDADVRTPSKLQGHAAGYSPTAATATASHVPALAGDTPVAGPTKGFKLPGSGQMVLPPHWKQEVDEQGATYFFNTATKKSQWEPPGVSLPSALPAAHEDSDEQDDPDATPRMK